MMNQLLFQLCLVLTEVFEVLSDFSSSAATSVIYCVTPNETTLKI